MKKAPAANRRGLCSLTRTDHVAGAMTTTGGGAVGAGVTTGAGGVTGIAAEGEAE